MATTLEFQINDERKAEMARDISEALKPLTQAIFSFTEKLSDALAATAVNGAKLAADAERAAALATLPEQLRAMHGISLNERLDHGIASVCLTFASAAAADAVFKTLQRLLPTPGEELLNHPLLAWAKSAQPK